jgi:hypothetical protein
VRFGGWSACWKEDWRPWLRDKSSRTHIRRRHRSAKSATAPENVRRSQPSYRKVTVTDRSSVANRVVVGRLFASVVRCFGSSAIILLVSFIADALRMISQTKTRLAWDMLPTEDGWSYKLFCTYLKMEPGSRSLSKVAQSFNRTKRNIEYFSSQNSWVARTREYDEHIEKQSLLKNNA